MGVDRRQMTTTVTSLHVYQKGDSHISDICGKNRILLPFVCYGPMYFRRAVSFHISRLYHYSCNRFIVIYTFVHFGLTLVHNQLLGFFIRLALLIFALPN